MKIIILLATILLTGCAEPSGLHQSNLKRVTTRNTALYVPPLTKTLLLLTWLSADYLRTKNYDYAA